MRDFIEIVTQTPIGEVKRTMPKAMFLEELARRATVFGDDVLEAWLKAHNLSRAEAIAMCDANDIPGILELAQGVQAQKTNKSLPEMRAFAQDAAEGNKLAQHKLSTLAWNAESMSDQDLEKELRASGMLQTRSRLDY
jgi:hypothetical protein